MDDLDELLESIRQLEELVEYKRTHMLEFFKPYPFQQKFIRNTVDHKQSALLASNRCGKSELSAYMMAVHLTGRYPKDWEGRKLTGANRLFFALGITQRSVANILQSKLLGSSDIRLEDQVGTGYIPKEDIVMDPMSRDGYRVVSMLVKHQDANGEFDGYNTLQFWTFSDYQKFMGSTVDGGIIMDEEDPINGMTAYSQALTRTTTCEEAFVITTFTAENGITPLVKMFLDAQSDPDSLIYVQNATMYDAHVDIGGHITDAMIDEIKAGSPEYEHGARIYGIPSTGAGAVFPYSEDDITYRDGDIEVDNMMVVGSLDWGQVRDATVVFHTLYDPSSDTYYAHSECVLDQSVEARTPESVANVILGGEFPNATYSCPHDTGLNSDNPQSKAALLKEYGIYNLHQHRNPTSLDLDAIKPNASSIAIMPGLNKMNQLFREGKLLINKDKCPRLLQEMRGYFYDSEKDGKLKFRAASGDHCIDAFRLGVMALCCGVYTAVPIAKMAGADRWSESAPAIENTFDCSYEYEEFV